MQTFRTEDYKIYNTQVVYGLPAMHPTKAEDLNQIPSERYRSIEPLTVDLRNMSVRPDSRLYGGGEPGGEPGGCGCTSCQGRGARRGAGWRAMRGGCMECGGLPACTMTGGSISLAGGERSSDFKSFKNLPNSKMYDEDIRIINPRAAAPINIPGQIILPSPRPFSGRSTEGIRQKRESRPITSSEMMRDNLSVIQNYTGMEGLDGESIPTVWMP